MVNLILKMLINYSFYLLYIIPEYIIKRKSSKTKEKSNEKHENNNNKVIYLHTDATKKMSLKNYLYLLFLLLLYFIYIFGMSICSIIYDENFKFLSNEFQNIMYIFCFYLLLRILHKTIFYKHQYLSFIIIFLIDLTRFFFFLFLIKEINFDFPYD